MKCTVALLLGVLVSMAAAAPVWALETGMVVPSLSATGRDGQTLSLDQFHGHWVYVDFWASWCAPCREAMPALDAIYRQYRDKDFVVLGVDVDTDRAAAQRMLDKFAPGFPIVFDPEGDWPTAFGLTGMPSGYLVDPHGVVRYVKTGYKAGDLPQLQATIRSALGEPP